MRIERWRLYQALSLIAAATLSAWPFPEWFAPWQPHWIAMVMIFWVITQTGKAGFGMAWVAGLASDLIVGNWVGIHIVSYSIIVYLCARFYRTLHFSGSLETSLPVGLLLALHLGYLHLLSIFLSNVDPGLIFWASLPTSMVVWPILYFLMKKIPAGEPGLP